MKSEIISIETKYKGWARFSVVSVCLPKIFAGYSDQARRPCPILCHRPGSTFSGAPAFAFMGCSSTAFDDGSRSPSDPPLSKPSRLAEPRPIAVRFVPPKLLTSRPRGEVDLDEQILVIIPWTVHAFGDRPHLHWLGRKRDQQVMRVRLATKPPLIWDACARTHGATYGVEHSADALVELAAWFNAEFVLVRV